MKTSTWRNVFLEYVKSKIAVEEWSLDNPSDELEFSATKPWAFAANTVGFLPPLRDVDITSPTPKETQGRATQELFVICRFPRELDYHELPIGKLEGIWTTLAALITLNWSKLLPPDQQGSRGLLGVSVAATEYPVSVQPAGEKRSDWIITLHWQFIVRWLVDLEEGEVSNPFEIREVRGSVYRSKLYDFENKILDFNGLFAPKAEGMVKPLKVVITPPVSTEGELVTLEVSDNRANEQLDIIVTGSSGIFTVVTNCDNTGKATIRLTLAPDLYSLDIHAVSSGRVGTGSFVVNAPPPTTPLVITVSSDPVITGASYNITVTGANPNEYLEFWIEEGINTYGTPTIVRADAGGIYSTTRVMGEPTEYKVKAVGIVSGRVGERLNLTSIYDPSIPLVITFTPNPISQGSTSTLQVSGGVPGEGVIVSGSVTQIGSFNSSGVYSVMLTPPQGSYPVTALALISGRSGGGTLVVNAPEPTALIAKLREEKVYALHELYYTDVSQFVPGETGMWYAAPGNANPADYENFPWKGGLTADSEGKFTLISTSGGAGSYWNIFKGLSSGRMSNAVLITFA